MIKWPIRIVVSLLFLACATIWVRSYFTAEMWTKQQTTKDAENFTMNRCNLASGSGSLHFTKSTMTMPVTPKNHDQWGYELSVKPDWQYQSLREISDSALPFTRSPNPSSTARSETATVLGFGHYHSDASTGSGNTVADSYVFPYWAPTLLFGLLPLFWVYRIFFPARKGNAHESEEFSTTTYQPAASRF